MTSFADFPNLPIQFVNFFPILFFEFFKISYLLLFNCFIRVNHYFQSYFQMVLLFLLLILFNLFLFTDYWLVFLYFQRFFLVLAFKFI